MADRAPLSPALPGRFGRDAPRGESCGDSAGAATPVTITASWCPPAEVWLHAPLARAVLAEKPHRRLARLRRKVARTLFHIVHQRIGLPAPAELRFANGKIAAVNCANTAFLDYAARNQRAEGVEPEVSGLLIGLAARLRVVYDVGANWGYYPLLLGAEARFRGVIHAFEIGPRTSADLRRVIAAAGLGERVTVHGFGLSDHEGEVRLSREKHSYLARIVGEGYRGAVDRVGVRRLDGLGLPPPDLIKVDVEGHELAVLRGAAGIIERDQPLVVMESWHEPVRTEAMLAPLRLLDGLGYRWHRLNWYPQPGGGIAPGVRYGSIVLSPLGVSERPAIRTTLNLLAVPARRAAEFGIK
ncbi:MAG TPA: FkbM family methyltransferase [Stellaceae bacterium]|nr:FkbM family methyltransferase [Stellaceae bacterium]